MESNPSVLVERRASVAVLTLNRPERLNALTAEMEERYFDHLAAADDDSSVRAIVVTGAGRGFCAGADLDELAAYGRADSDYRAGTRPKTFALTLRKPVIAAINGACAGLGLVHALSCDLRFVARDAKITTAFSRRGLVAEHGISWLLPRLVGPARALDLLLSGRVITGAEAQTIGLAQWCTAAEDVLPEAIRYAAELADLSAPWSMSAMKRQVYDHLDRGFADALAASNALLAESLRRSDVQEGVASFVERRKPSFRDLTPKRTA